MEVRIQQLKKKQSPGKTKVSLGKPLCSKELNFSGILEKEMPVAL